MSRVRSPFWGWFTVVALAAFLGGAAVQWSREQFSAVPAQAQQSRGDGFSDLSPAAPAPRRGLSAVARRADDLPATPLTPSSASASELWDPEGWTQEERINIAVYEKANRGVVNITTRSMRTDRFWMTAVPSEGAGSGSILDDQGHILTNYHVIEDAHAINVTLYNGQSYDAMLVGQDPDNDIAVLKIDVPAEQLHPVEATQNHPLRVGQKVYAIGNPFGLERTLTVGIISSLNRSLPSRGQRTMKSIIQIDAALNRGNSGGPLLDSHGQLIGMNTAIASSTGENTGVGFAIPIASIRRVVPQILEHGRVIRPDTGIAHAVSTEEGLVVASVTPGGPAEQAGLRGFRMVRQQQQRGPFLYERTYVDRNYADRILTIDDQPVQTMDDLLSAVEHHQPGDRITLRIVRDGREQEITIRLGIEE